MSQPTPIPLTPEQDRALEVGRVGLMSACPFFAHYFYSQLSEVYTKDISTAATDGRRIYLNPEYVAGLKPSERVFVYAHEVHHAIQMHPTRMEHYHREGRVRQTDYDQDQFNKALDYVINADLIQNGIGTANPAWCYDKATTPDMLGEDVYERIYVKPPPGSGGSAQGPGQGGAGGGSGGTMGGPGAPDPHAQNNGGRFDSLLPPQTDPATGKDDLPSPAEYREAVARAAAAAKGQGNMKASHEKLVADILEPTVRWQDHIRMLLVAKAGQRRETWTRPNRRRLVLNPMVITPGRAGNGSDCIAIGIDTSGSIYADEQLLAKFWAEISAIVTDCRPKRVILIECDAAVQRAREATSIHDIEYSRSQAVKGGGGTRFEPVFNWLKKEGIRPDALVYLTDLMGSFPSKDPGYPVIWAATEDLPVPFGERVMVQ